MSRGDEIQEDGPRRSRQPTAPPARKGYHDDREEREDLRQRDRIDKPNRSGLVMSVGILGIILGSLGLVSLSLGLGEGGEEGDQGEGIIKITEGISKARVTLADKMIKVQARLAVLLQEVW